MKRICQGSEPSRPHRVGRPIHAAALHARAFLSVLALLVLASILVACPGARTAPKHAPGEEPDPVMGEPLDRGPDVPSLTAYEARYAD